MPGLAELEGLTTPTAGLELQGVGLVGKHLQTSPVTFSVQEGLRAQLAASFDPQ